MTALNRFVAAALAWAGALPVTALPLQAAEPLVAEAIVSAPVDTVWQAFTTPSGLATVGVADAVVDLRLGGRIEVRTAAPGQSSAGTATVSEILSFEPQRLLSLRVRQSPVADANAFANTWSNVYFTPLGPDMTHVRIAGFGFNEGPSAAALSRFFAQDLAAHLQRIEKHYWPLCALCKAEGQP